MQWRRTVVADPQRGPLLVMKAVRGDNGRRAWLWWLLAVIFHAGANAVAVGVNQIAGPIATEGVLTVIAAIAVVIIARVRKAERASKPIPVVAPAD